MQLSHTTLLNVLFIAIFHSSSLCSYSLLLCSCFLISSSAGSLGVSSSNSSAFHFLSWSASSQNFLGLQKSIRKSFVPSLSPQVTDKSHIKLSISSWVSKETI